MNNYPGYRPGSIDFDERNPQNSLAQIIERDQLTFDFFYNPVISDVISSLQDTSIVDTAREGADAAFDKGEARSLRQMSRYNVNMSPAAQKQFNLRQQLSKTLNKDAVVNDARLDLKERNDGLRRQLIDIGRGVADTASSGLTSASRNQAQREANNRNAEAAKDAQNTQTAASVAQMALMFYLLS
jgi:hypothetical protein